MFYPIWNKSDKSIYYAIAILLLLINPVYILVTLILMFASYQSWKVYQFIKINEYLIFSLVFIFVGLDTFIISLGYNGSFPDFICFISYISLLYYLQFRLDGNTKSLKSSIPLYVFICFIIPVTFAFENQFGFLLYIRFLAADLMLLILGVKFIITHLQSEVVYTTMKTTLAHSSWIFLGLLFVIVGLVRGLIFASLSYTAITSDIDVTLDHNAIISTNFMVTISFFLFGIIMLFMIFLTPEVLILTEPQLFRVKKLYTMENMSENQEKNYHLSVGFVHEYLSDLAESSDTVSKNNINMKSNDNS